MQNWYSYNTLIDKLSDNAYSAMTDEVRASERVQNAMVVRQTGEKLFSIEKFLGCFRNWKDNTTPKENRRLILDFRVQLIGYLVNHTVDTFCNNLESIDSGEYNEEILKDDPYCINEAISKFTTQYIISHPAVQTTEIKGQSVINGLLDLLIFYAFHPEKKYQAKVKGVISEARIESAMHENLYNDEVYFDRRKHSPSEFSFGDMNEYDRLRLIVDFVASMTDKYSLTLYQKFKGITL